MLLLARTMGMTAEELTARMGVEEFVEHLADYATDPWGEYRADLRSGMVASILHNVHRAEGTEARTAHDFVLFRQIDQEAEAERNRRQFMDRQRIRMRSQ